MLAAKVISDRHCTQLTHEMLHPIPLTRKKTKAITTYTASLALDLVT